MNQNILAKYFDYRKTKPGFDWLKITRILANRKQETFLFDNLIIHFENDQYDQMKMKYFVAQKFFWSDGPK